MNWSFYTPLSSALRYNCFQPHSCNTTTMLYLWSPYGIGQMIMFSSCMNNFVQLRLDVRGPYPLSIKDVTRKSLLHSSFCRCLRTFLFSISFILDHCIFLSLSCFEAPLNVGLGRHSKWLIADGRTDEQTDWLTDWQTDWFSSSSLLLIRIESKWKADCYVDALFSVKEEGRYWQDKNVAYLLKISGTIFSKTALHR